MSEFIFPFPCLSSRSHVVFLQSATAPWNETTSSINARDYWKPDSASGLTVASGAERVALHPNALPHLLFMFAWLSWFVLFRVLQVNTQTTATQKLVLALFFSFYKL